MLLCSRAEITELNKPCFWVWAGLVCALGSLKNGSSGNASWLRYSSLASSTTHGAFVSKSPKILIENGMKQNSWLSMRLNSDIWLPSPLPKTNKQKNNLKYYCIFLKKRKGKRHNKLLFPQRPAQQLVSLIQTIKGLSDFHMHEKEPWKHACQQDWKS